MEPVYEMFLDEVDAILEFRSQGMALFSFYGHGIEASVAPAIAAHGLGGQGKIILLVLVKGRDRRFGKALEGIQVVGQPFGHAVESAKLAPNSRQAIDPCAKKAIQRRIPKATADYGLIAQESIAISA